MGRRTWIKIFADKWLTGTLREETSSTRGIWIDILALAGDSTYGDEGIIQVADGVGLTDEQIAAILHIKKTHWEEAKQRLIETNRIKVLKNNVIKISNWKKYQSEYFRQRGYRQKLQPKVTTEGDKEKREERREKRDIKKESSRERNKHSLSKKDKDLIIKNQKHYLEYGVNLKYIQTFFNQCEAKNYKYADFGKALLVWARKDGLKKPKKADTRPTLEILKERGLIE